MTNDDIETIRGLIRLEIEAVIRQHAYSFTQACVAPLMEAVGQVLENQKLIADGQQLVEKHLAGQVPDDDEPWRRSLDGS